MLDSETGILRRDCSGRELNAPKSVVLASLQKDWGGGEVYLSTLARHLRDRSVNVELIVRAGSAMDEFAAAQGFTAARVWGRGRSPFELWKLRRWISNRPGAVVHCNDSHALTAVGVASLGVNKAGVVAMRHTMFPIQSAAKYCRIADCVIGVSHAVVDACENQGIPASKLRVIHAGIDVPVVSKDHVDGIRREFLDSDQTKLIVAVGNLLACKGHATLIRAMAELKSQGVKSRLVIAGEGAERVSLENQIRSLHLTDAVILAGFRNDANALMAAADVVAHPALVEGLCLSVAAALMLERPVVCTASGGLSEVIGLDPRMQVDGPFASVVEPGEVLSLAHALRKQLEDTINQERRNQAKRFVIDRFTAERMVDETLILYRSLSTRAGVAA